MVYPGFEPGPFRSEIRSFETIILYGITFLFLDRKASKFGQTCTTMLNFWQKIGIGKIGRSYIKSQKYLNSPELLFSLKFTEGLNMN
jgi:hypothetical protein